MLFHSRNLEFFSLWNMFIQHMSNDAWEFLNDILGFKPFKTMNVARETGKCDLSLFNWLQAAKSYNS